MMTSHLKAANKRFKRDSQRAAFLLCVGLCVYGVMRKLSRGVGCPLSGRYVKGVNLRTIYYFIAIIVVPILAILFYAIFHQFSLSNNQIDWGAFGSFVGGVSAPVVAAITLVFLVNSNQEQARQTSLKVCIELVNDHATLVNNYKLPNVNSEYWTGRESLKEL
ncbi:hypothetical protein [Vibrio vulnificus]|uniref:hypothetical protein n=1 Tax=Vibrio vulnificus TaxID=672 RepID=UPI00405A125C